MESQKLDYLDHNVHLGHMKANPEDTSMNVAEAKRRLSDLLGRVAFGNESFLITRRGKPMARLVPVSSGPPARLGDSPGWLDDDNPFFADLDRLIAERDDETDRRSEIED